MRSTAPILSSWRRWSKRSSTKRGRPDESRSASSTSGSGSWASASSPTDSSRRRPREVWESDTPSELLMAVQHHEPPRMVRTMELNNLGRTGLKVSPLCLGAMMFGAWGNTDHDDSVKIIHKALDSGVNFIDTADVYSEGESEIVVGKALSSIDRSRVVLATKVHGQMGDDPLSSGNSRRWIIAEVEHSLKRLGVEYIDLYQIHRPDETTD